MDNAQTEVKSEALMDTLLKRGLNPFATFNTESKKPSAESKSTGETKPEITESSKLLSLKYSDKTLSCASIFDKIAPNYLKYSKICQNVADLQNFNIPDSADMPAWYKVDVAIKINSATNSYIFMNSLPLLGSYKMRDWLQSQKKQESTKNNKFFCMDLSSFGENAVKIVLKALLTGDFERGCKRDRDVSNLVRNFNIGYGGCV